MVSRMTQQFFENVDWGKLDYLILDLPPGTGDIQLTLVQKIALSGAVIITTPQNLSLVDVKKGSDMFKKVNVPLLGVIENMSKYYINGKIKNYNNSNMEMTINDSEKVNIDKDGRFKLKVDVFKGIGGQLESERLDIPLIGKISMDPYLSLTSDAGIPYVLREHLTENLKEFRKISEIISQ